MSEEDKQHDRFWLYVGGTVLALLMTIAVVKQSENEKFAPIKQQIDEENAQMNIRVLENRG
ncbi:MAG: hypothetical protein WAX77_08965 [Methylococcaceae bacterium]